MCANACLRLRNREWEMRSRERSSGLHTVHLFFHAQILSHPFHLALVLVNNGRQSLIILLISWSLDKQAEMFGTQTMITNNPAWFYNAFASIPLRRSLTNLFSRPNGNHKRRQKLAEHRDIFIASINSFGPIGGAERCLLSFRIPSRERRQIIKSLLLPIPH